MYTAYEEKFGKDPRTHWTDTFLERSKKAMAGLSKGEVEEILQGVGGGGR